MSSLRSLPAIVAGGVAAVVPAAVYAAGDGGLPQLQTDSYVGQLFWLAVSFLALFLLMWRVALPRVVDTLDKREKKLAGDIEQAENLRAEAKKIEASIEKTLTEARTEAQRILAEAAEEISTERARRIAAFEEDALKLAAEAESKIQQARSEALKDVHAAAADVAMALMEKVSGEKVEAAEMEKACKQAFSTGA